MSHFYRNLNQVFGKELGIDEDTVVNYMFSREITYTFGRCFGSLQSMKLTDNIRSKLQQLIFYPCTDISQDDVTIKFLVRSGILLESAGNFEFASPMALRYFSEHLFPNRAPANTPIPSSLLELITIVLGNVMLPSAAQS